MKTELCLDGTLDVPLVHGEDRTAKFAGQLGSCQHAQIAALRCGAAILRELPGQGFERLPCLHTREQLICSGLGRSFIVS